MNGTDEHNPTAAPDRVPLAAPQDRVPREQTVAASLSGPSVETPPVRCYEPRRLSRGRAARLWAVLVLAGCVALLGLAVRLKPDPQGFGTHAQLGMAPCSWLIVTGYPCPTCGMTTAFAYTVRLQWLRAVDAQVLGFLLALGTIAMVPITIVVLARGRWPRIPLPVLTPYRLFFTLLVLFFGAWGLKIVLGLWRHTLPLR